jgi:hypothetical protein
MCMEAQMPRAQGRAGAARACRCGGSGG